MKRIILWGCVLVAAIACHGVTRTKNIYHKGWIDLNKNGVKDIYEDPSQPVERRHHLRLSVAWL